MEVISWLYAKWQVNAVEFRAREAVQNWMSCIACRHVTLLTVCGNHGDLRQLLRRLTWWREPGLRPVYNWRMDVRSASVCVDACCRILISRTPSVKYRTFLDPSKVEPSSTFWTRNAWRKKEIRCQFFKSPRFVGNRKPIETLKNEFSLFFQENIFKLRRIQEFSTVGMLPVVHFLYNLKAVTDNKRIAT